MSDACGQDNLDNYQRPKWKENFKDKFSEYLCNDKINLCNERLTQLLNNRNNVEQHDIDLISDSVCDIMKKCA